MVTAVVAACAVVLACASTLLVLRRSRAASERGLEAVLEKIDGHLEAISSSVVQAVERVVAARSEPPEPVPTLDFDALVDSLVADVAVRTGADAVVLRLEGRGRSGQDASLRRSGRSATLAAFRKERGWRWPI